MVLEDLHELIETLQARIDAHAPALQQSEALTRYALIDPLLRGLGWDTGDPAQVRVEYFLPKGYAHQGFADYALLRTDEKAQVVIEAKSLQTPLGEAAAQANIYCAELGIPFFAVTDGRRWELYETFRPVPRPEKLVVVLDIAGPPTDTCLAALALWRPSVTSGNIKTVPAPVIDSQETASTPTTSADSSASPPDGGQWRDLSQFTPESGTTPRSVRLPDETEADTRGWGDFIAEIGRWLHQNGHLKASLLPIQRSKNSNVVAKTPVNPNGKSSSAYRQIGPFYANINLTSRALVRNARTMIERTGQNPADFAVRLQ